MIPNGDLWAAAFLSQQARLHPGELDRHLREGSAAACDACSGWWGDTR